MEIYNKHLTIEEELKWYEKKFTDAKAYVDGIDLANLTDRIEWKPTSKGGMLPMVIASKESQFKSFLDGMKELPKIMDALDNLRNKYAEKQFIGRGKIETKNTAMDFITKLD